VAAGRESASGGVTIGYPGIINIDALKKTGKFRVRSEASLGTQDNREAMISVVNELKKEGILEDVGGPSYISSLINAVSTAANIETYAKIVHDKAVLRQLIEAGTKKPSEPFNSSLKLKLFLTLIESFSLIFILSCFSRFSYSTGNNTFRNRFTESPSPDLVITGSTTIRFLISD
jgi:hypothetical protein